MNLLKQTEQEKLKNQPADIVDEITVLETMTVRELAVKYFEVFGETTKSRNKPYLVKRIAYRIQEKAEGGLSRDAEKRIEELAKNTPIRRRDLDDLSPSQLNVKEGTQLHADSEIALDPRLPPIGETVTRRYDNKKYEVRILKDGFEYDGVRYQSLSAVAKKVTGTEWNGFRFFGLTKTKERMK
ncbi:MAG: DUF2924 domain-containing protein [Deltaproteobacteria bacterium]|nr:DUF2924 domain-containing protein [Deltaproteobacteria bacterium]